MTLADLSIKRPVFAWMLMLALILFGGISFTQLGVSQLPDVDFPVITVSLTLEGAAPEIMESDVVDIVEDVLTTVEGVREITSSSRQGAATVSVEFELERDIDLALQDVQAKIAQAQRRLPDELDPPVITKTNPEDQPIMWVGLSGTRSPGELADYARYEVRTRLQTLPGVAEVMMGGYRERNMRVWLDRTKLEREGVTVPDVLDALRREHVEVPAGRIESPAKERNVRSEGEALSAEEVANVVVLNRDGRLVRVRDVAAVEFGLEDKRRISRLNGLPSIGLGVKKQRGANAVAVARAVRAEVRKLAETLPENLNLAIMFDSTQFIEDSVEQIEHEIVLAVILTSFVCWLFLGSWSATFNVLLSIPTSLIGAFAAFYFLGFTLNTFTLLALTLAVGIVVDDAIMVLENIFRHKEMGKSKVRAAREGANEITFAAMAATIAIIAIFLPVAFMKGIIGKFFFQFGVALSIAVALSLLEALTLTPMRCSQFMGKAGHDTRVGRVADRLFGGLRRGYAAALGGAIRHPLLVLSVATAIFVVSLGLVGRLGWELVPPQDQSRIMVRLETPVGSSIDYTDDVLRNLEGVLASRPEVDRYFAAVGGFGGGEVNTGIMFVTLVPPEKRELSQQELIAVLRREMNQFPDAKVIPLDLSQQGFSAQRGYPVEFSIRGPRFEVLAAKEAEFTERMRASGLFVDIHSDYFVGMPEVRVHPQRDRAADLGVSMQAIGDTVATLIGGVRVGKFKEGGHRYDMRVRLMAPQRLRPEDIETLYVRSRGGSAAGATTAANGAGAAAAGGGGGELVRLDQVVKIEQVPTLLSIQRRGRERSISVFANVAPGTTQDRALAEIEKIAAEILPDGYKAVFSGSAQASLETRSSLLFALALGIIVAYMVLASQFNSYLHPVTVLLALPFSVTGALIALWAGGYTLNMYSMIGLVLLMGIVKKNSIILVDYTNQRREEMNETEGPAPDRRSELERVRRALAEACPVRLRPILMTSFATMSAAVPAALQLGAGAETRAPMAMAVIGGVAVSTLLTLFVVPSFYMVAERARALLPARKKEEENLGHTAESKEEVAEPGRA